MFCYEEPDLNEEHPIGPRMPAPPITCTIDFDNLCIVATGIPPIFSYELWYENGEAIIASYSDDKDLVQHILSYTGNFQLRITTERYTYIGYLEL